MDSDAKPFNESVTTLSGQLIGSGKGEFFITVIENKRIGGQINLVEDGIAYLFTIFPNGEINILKKSITDVPLICDPVL